MGMDETESLPLSYPLVTFRCISMTCLLRYFQACILRKLLVNSRHKKSREKSSSKVR